MRPHKVSEFLLEQETTQKEPVIGFLNERLFFAFHTFRNIKTSAIIAINNCRSKTVAINF